MTIDERIEKLTERHEALTQSVELISHKVETLVDSMIDLVKLVRSHEPRISDLERS